MRTGTRADLAFGSFGALGGLGAFGGFAFFSFFFLAGFSASSGGGGIAPSFRSCSATAAPLSTMDSSTAWTGIRVVSGALPADTFHVVRFTGTEGLNRLFSFRLDAPALNRLADAAERYLQAHAERRFPTLDYWKNVRSI